MIAERRVTTRISSPGKRIENRIMNLAQLLLDQVDREVASTRRALERVPDGREEWKPHPKSMPLGYLSTLIATMFGWIAMMIEKEHLDLAEGKAPSTADREDRLRTFDQSVAAARAALSNTTEEHLLEPWQLRVAGKVVDEKPRHQMIVDTISHLAHHRGQLSVYLRLNDQPVPSSYGPTADESWS
jgi:uncharacterized damage-inducible protein DinB